MKNEIYKNVIKSLRYFGNLFSLTKKTYLKVTTLLLHIDDNTDANLVTFTTELRK